MVKAVGINRNVCVAPIAGKTGPYGYDPSLVAGIIFSVFFGLSMLGHVFASIRNRVWWQIVFAVGALTELIGWAGRAASAHCPYQTTPFLIQIVCLIIAPAFITAGIYVILGRLIRTFGNHVSPITPNTYLYIFCTADLISLVVQAIGGAFAAGAYAKNPPGDTTTGTHIMVAGIIFQLASIIIFSVLFTWVIINALRSKGQALRERKIQWLIAAVVFAVVLVVIRSIYRTIELLQGWTGYLIIRERYFIALDGAMMILALGVFNVVQPRWSMSGTDKGERVTSMSTLPENGMHGAETEASSIDAGAGDMRKVQQEK